MIAFVFTLGAWLWAMPWLLAAGAATLVVWLVFRELNRQGEREFAQQKRRRAEHDAVVARATEQHNLRMQGDPRGVYGVATPAVRQFERLQQR